MKDREAEDEKALNKTKKANKKNKKYFIELDPGSIFT
jgi:hypothetical protein